MVHERIAAEKVDVAILGTELTFRNGRKTKNRFLKAALSEKMATWDAKDHSKRGIPTQQLINIYDKWGHGGYGVILTGNVCVDPCNLESAGNTIMCKENASFELKTAFAKMADISKSDGALIMAQISHGGRQTPLAVNEHPYSVSDDQSTSSFVTAGKPIPLSLEQIKTEVVDRFVYTAKYAYDTALKNHAIGVISIGFDGVEIHAAHGFLLSQFLSRSSNKRTDKYGGPLENRTRVIVEIYEEIRKIIPASAGFVIGIKLNLIEFQNDGLSVEESAAICSIMDRCGYDFIELTGGSLFRPSRIQDESARKREAYYAGFAIKIRSVVKNTVLYVTGGFRTAKAMVDCIKSGFTDGIGLGRPTTAEPGLERKFASGVRPLNCIDMLSVAAIPYHFNLPKKILKQECFSAADMKINQDDFYMTYLVCTAQMGQMAKRPVSQLKNICDGIADLSRAEEAENFKKLVVDYVRETAKLNKEQRPVYGVFQYENLF